MEIQGLFPWDTGSSDDFHSFLMFEASAKNSTTASLLQVKVHQRSSSGFEILRMSLSSLHGGFLKPKLLREIPDPVTGYPSRWEAADGAQSVTDHPHVVDHVQLSGSFVVVVSASARSQWMFVEKLRHRLLPVSGEDNDSVTQLCPSVVSSCFILYSDIPVHFTDHFIVPMTF